MVIVYESKTGFTKRYADMLSAKTGIKAYRASELSSISPGEEIIFMGWIKVGIVQGLKKAKGRRIAAVCASGTGRAAEPDEATVLERNGISGIPLFYLRGGCLPLNQLKGMDRMMLSMFVKMLKGRKDEIEKSREAVGIIVNGFDGVKEENLEPVLTWLGTRGGRKN